MAIKRQSTSDKLKYNKNAEKWTIDVALKFMDDAVALSELPEYDFIGEIAKDLGFGKSTIDYVIDKFPELKKIKTRIIDNVETNCFRNMKKENINVATGMINLKSNHGWVDRQQIDNTSKDGSMSPKPLFNIDPLSDDIQTNKSTSQDSETTQAD